VSDAAMNDAAPVTRTVVVVQVVAPVLELEYLRNPTNDTRISFETVLGLDYRIESSTNMIQWNLLQTVSGDDSLLQFTHTGGGSGNKRFYKVIVTKSGQ
jgi:hypothetical protein